MLGGLSRSRPEAAHPSCVGPVLSPLHLASGVCPPGGPGLERTALQRPLSQPHSLLCSPGCPGLEPERNSEQVATGPLLLLSGAQPFTAWCPVLPLLLSGGQPFTAWCPVLENCYCTRFDCSVLLWFFQVWRGVNPVWSLLPRLCWKPHQMCRPVVT